jgi:hypothetical protein
VVVLRARGDKAMGVGRVDARTLRPRPPLVVTDASGRRHPVGRFAVGGGAVWTQVPEQERVWRVPLAGGQARAIGVSGFGYGLAADGRAAWVLSGASDPGIAPDRTGRLRRLDRRTGAVTATTPLPDLAANLAVGPVVGDGAVWLAGPSTRLQQGGGILLWVDPASGRLPGGSGVRWGSARTCSPPGHGGRGWPRRYLSCSMWCRHSAGVAGQRRALDLRKGEP